jgi:hypothetical protein
MRDAPNFEPPYCDVGESRSLENGMHYLRSVGSQVLERSVGLSLCTQFVTLSQGFLHDIVVFELLSVCLFNMPMKITVVTIILLGSLHGLFHHGRCIKSGSVHTMNQQWNSW